MGFSLQFPRQPAILKSRFSSALAAVILMALLCIVIFITPVFPFIDYYAHVARYYILAELANGPPTALSGNYEANWRLLPNLGLDIIATAMMLAFEPLVVAKIIVAAVVVTLFTGILYLNRVLHGSVSTLSVLLAGIISFHHILAWGFMNFCFGLGLMVWALGFWIANDARPNRQLAVSVPIGIGLLLVHGVVFALWGLMLGMIELARLWDERRLFHPDLVVRMGRLILLAIIPAILFLQMPTAGAQEGVTEAFDNLAEHTAQGNFWPRIQQEILSRIDSILRVTESRWLLADYASNILIWSGLAVGLVSGHLRLHRRLWGVTVLALVLVPLTPPNLFGVGYIDSRIPVLLFLLLAAGLRIESRSETRHRILIAAAVALAARLALTGAGWSIDGQFYRDYLARIDTLSLEGPAKLVMVSTATERNTSSTRCEPLLPLLLLRAGVPVGTFAHATQQPLRLSGPLADAVYSSPEDISAAKAPPDYLTALAAQGFATIVTCGPKIPETILMPVAEGRTWTIFSGTEPLVDRGIRARGRPGETIATD